MDLGRVQVAIGGIEKHHGSLCGMKFWDLQCLLES